MKHGHQYDHVDVSVCLACFSHPPDTLLCECVPVCASVCVCLACGRVCKRNMATAMLRVFHKRAEKCGEKSKRGPGKARIAKKSIYIYMYIYMYNIYIYTYRKEKQREMP